MKNINWKIQTKKQKSWNKLIRHIRGGSGEGAKSCEFYGSVVQLRKFFSNKNGSLSKCFFNEHKLTFSQFLRKKRAISNRVYGQYQKEHFQNGNFFDFLKKQAFSKRAFFEKNEKRAYPKRPFFENLISKRAFFRFPNGEKKPMVRGLES